VVFDRDKTSRMDGGGIAMDAASMVEGLLRLKAKLRVVLALVLLVVLVMVIVHLEPRMSVFLLGFLGCFQIFSWLQIVVIIEVNLAGAQLTI
jgi:hypothetical protein